MTSAKPGELTLPQFERDAPLASLTSWRVGGLADFLAQPRTLEELRATLAWFNSQSIPLTILGGGTNVLISDRGVRGAVIALGKMMGLSVEQRSDRLHITCLAGTPKSELLRVFLRHRLEPALFLAGLPGDVGGGVAMNAGVGEMIKPREFNEITDWIDVFRIGKPGDSVIDLDHVKSEDLQWGYRRSGGWEPGVIARIGLSWPLEPVEDVLNRVKLANKERFGKQPLDQPNCGSVFVNPSGHKAGKLIQDCGLKGYVRGGAQVSEKHANFIVNNGGAKAADIDAIIEHVRNTVLEKTGIELLTEVVYLGVW
jgi:UDP-N-acetylmuramate dehydrogenase